VNLVLIHGAWHGGWCWDRLVPLLEQQGHRVFAPTLTGCGERSAEATPEVTLETHVADVVDVLDRLPGGESAVLVGHSYGGVVIAGVAELRSHQLDALLYLDAFCPEDGESSFTFIPPEHQAWFRQLAIDEGDGWRLPPTKQLLDLWGLHDEHDRQWAWERLTDSSLPCFESAVRAPQRRFASLPRIYVAATADDYPLRPVFEPIVNRLRDDGCRLVEVPTGHEIMIQAPEKVAQLVSQLTREHLGDSS
jgi:pimeloyl-ACP methyl ester carboxylesterase